MTGKEAIMWTIIIIILIVLLVGSLFYRPLGAGYPGYVPSGIFAVLLLLIVLLLLLHVI
jgi:hypothetical protein